MPSSRRCRPTAGNKLAAARLLGISRATLYQRLALAGATPEAADAARAQNAARRRGVTHAQSQDTTQHTRRLNMQSIGFIGASGLMGHGMAKNLRAKGHPLAIDRVPQRASAWPTCWPPAPSEAAIAGGAGRGAATSSSCASPARRRSKPPSPGADGLLAGAAAGSLDRRLLDQRTRLDRPPARALRCGRRELRRCAAGAHAGRGRGRQAQRDGRRRRRPTSRSSSRC